METNQLGKSIVKASIILASALVLSVILYVVSRDRYTSLGVYNGRYIDQKTGITYDDTQNANR
jgi:archaellum component FlaF (FlaF/FlaG flagellin family)